jgi:hypothetical protein
VPAKIRKEERALHYQALLFGVSGLMNEGTEKKAGFRKLLPIWKSYQDSVPASSLKKEDWSLRAIPAS